MNFFDNLKMALFSIKSNRMRSFLTMLGIIIGISSVITILGVGGGARAYMMGSIEQVGASTVQVTVNDKEATDSDYITFDDIEALRGKVEHLKYISPQIGVWGSTTFKKKTNDAIIYGCSDSFNYFMGTDMVSGRFFTEEDYLAARNVAVIDEIAAMQFFGNTNVSGMTLELEVWGERMKIKIVGVAKSQQGNFYYEGMPFYFYMPITTLFNNTGTDPTLSSIYLMADDPAFATTMGNSARNVLESRHGNRGRDIYRPESLMGEVDQMNSMLDIITTFISAVAAISLLVGGIGVMNIMLVAVTERTREIGIRKSLGAKTKSIMGQFLTESAILSLIGGLIGLVLGILGAMGVSSLVSGMAGGTITPSITINHILLALGFSCSVGIFFGIYPARKAAKLNPIEALRHE